MSLIIISAILYSVSAVLSVTFAFLIINKLYISKKFTKERDFHFYNDLFSWEMFYFFIAAENVVKIFSLFLSANTQISDLLFRIRILILFFPFWNKIIHLERVMDKITYERHYFAGMIPLIMALLLGFTVLPNFVLMLIFFGTSFLPFLFFAIFLKNSNSTKGKTLKIIIGAIFIIMGCILRPEIFSGFPVITGILNSFIILTNVIAPTSLIIGVLLIFNSFRKEIK